jgi:Mn2+/Fe2+ NRAMP family transporter
MNAFSQLARRLGPGLITASVVIGPGSIVAASSAGAQGGYRLVWLIVVACVLMATFTAMAARLGCALETTPIQFLAKRWGRWAAVVVGLSSFLVTSGYQFANNIGVAAALNGLTGTAMWIWPLAFTAGSILFLFTAKNLYRQLERVMMVLVAVMLTAFVVNLFWTGIDLPKLAGGLIPRWVKEDANVAPALLGTSFSTVAALYQAYLVRAKGWGRDELGDSVRDAWLGIGILGCISGVILIGAAQTLYGSGAEFGNVGALAGSLKEALGPAANIVFCTGLVAASFSSFIVNTVIGGALLADGLGLSPDLNGRPAKILAVVGMVLGCAVAVSVLAYEASPAKSILVAQAGVLVAAPVAAALVLVLASRRTVMGGLRNGPITIVIGLLGLAFILYRGIDWLLGKVG